jgi:hypothetical protein
MQQSEINPGDTYAHNSDGASVRVSSVTPKGRGYTVHYAAADGTLHILGARKFLSLFTIACADTPTNS